MSAPAVPRDRRVLISPPPDLPHILQFDGLFPGVGARSRSLRSVNGA